MNIDYSYRTWVYALLAAGPRNPHLLKYVNSGCSALAVAPKPQLR
jgi:hypothetical protein